MERRASRPTPVRSKLVARSSTNPAPNPAPIRYHNVIMSLSVVLIKILEFMFVAGWAGSAVVLLLTGYEDIGTLLDRKDENSH